MPEENVATETKAEQTNPAPTDTTEVQNTEQTTKTVEEIQKEYEAKLQSEAELY